MLILLFLLWRQFSPRPFFLLYWSIIDLQYYIILYYHLHSMVIWYFYTLWDDHHKSSYHLSPCKLITVLLTIFPMLYRSLLWFIYFIIRSLYFVIPFIYLIHVHFPRLLPAMSLFSVSMSLFLLRYVCLFVLLLDSTYKWNLWYMSFYLWLISFSIIYFGYIHIVIYGKISLFPAVE